MSSIRILICPVVLLCAVLVGAQLQNGSGSPHLDDSGPMLLEDTVSIAMLDSARRDLFAYRMRDAERSLRRLEQRPDGRPAALYHLTLAALHRALMSDGAEHFEAFYARSDSLAGALARAEPTAWRDYMRADRDLWQAVAHLKRGRYLRAAWSGRSAYRTYERIVEVFPAFYDGYMGLGLLHLSIGSMPRTYRFVLDVLGYDGGIARGIGELETAYRRARYASDEAGALLAVTRQMLYLDKGEGLRVAADLHNDHPESTFYAHIYGFALIANRQIEAATSTLSEAIRRSESEGYFYDHYLDFYLAEALFRASEFGEAERYYRRYLDRHGGPALKSQAYLGLGRSLEMQGRRDEAVAAFEHVRSARTFDTDEAAGRESEQFLAGPISSHDRRLLLAANAYDGDRLDEAAGLLTVLRAEGELTNDQTAEIAYRLGRVHQAGGRFARAVAEFERAEAAGGNRLSRWAPWSAFFIGKIHVQEGRLDEARVAFERAQAHKGKYDYYQALEQCVRAALELMPR